MTAPSDTLPGNPSLAAQMRPALVKYFQRKTGSAVEAEDLAQDVLVRALGHADWESPHQAKGYIFRTAINRWRDFRRRRRTHGVSVTWEDKYEQELGVENPPERVLIVREELNQISQVLAELNVRTRTVFMLIKWEQMTASAVAEMLGISVSAVNKHLAHALMALAALRHEREPL